MTDPVRPPLRALLALEKEIRARAAEFAAYRGAACQCEPSWHAQELTLFADKLAAVLDRIGACQGCGPGATRRSKSRRSEK